MNKGQFTSERAREIGKIGALKFAEAKRGTSSAPLCVACLYRIGWGIRRIVRHTGCAKTTVHRFAKARGLIDAGKAEGKRAQANAVRKRKAKGRYAAVLMAQAFRAECGTLRSQEANHWPKRTIVKRGVLKLATAMDLYYANHAEEKERCRIRAVKRYRSERDAIKKGAPASRYWVASRVRSRINAVIRNALARKSVRSEELCGCSWSYLIKHIESQFYARMSWANYGRAWHIDHVIPCASFDLRDEQQQRMCFHYTNLRPMWARANLRKSDKITDPQFNLMLPAA